MWKPRSSSSVAAHIESLFQISKERGREGVTGRYSYARRKFISVGLIY